MYFAHRVKTKDNFVNLVQMASSWKSRLRGKIVVHYSILTFQTRFDEVDSIPDGHEGDAKEEAEDAADLGDHGRGRVEELLSLNRSVPETTVIQHSAGTPRTGKERKDGML